MATTEPIRNRRHIRALAEYYLRRGEFRNYILIVMAIHTALRVSDLLRLRWEDVYDFKRRCVRKSIRLAEKKTGKTKIIALGKDLARAVSSSVSQGDARPDGFVFKSRKTGRAISRIQAYRVIRAAAEAIGLQARVSCHSLRKTFGYHAWKNGVSPAVIMEIYNHSSFAVTRRYLGVSQDDKDEAYLKITFLS
jgi:integrase